MQGSVHSNGQIARLVIQKETCGGSGCGCGFVHRWHAMQMCSRKSVAGAAALLI